MKSRPTNKRSTSKRLSIICEGQTEVDYINNYIKDANSKNKDYISIELSKHTDPKGMLKLAIDRQHDSNDIVWIVYDRESDSKYIEQYHVEVFMNAAKNNINIAFSNRCFEVWLYYHFCNTCAYPHSNCDGFINDKRFKEYFLNYKKGMNKRIYTLIKSQVESAVNNIKQIRNQLDDISSTQRVELQIGYCSVDRLLEAINGFKS